MAKKTYLNLLFDAHTKDLNDVHPGMGDVIVCPICLGIFPREAISQKLLTDGHVWPDYIRKKSKSKVALHQRVLLCKPCNSMTGSRGDKHMQLREKIKDGEKAGQLYGKRKLQILTSPGEKPIRLRAEVNMQKGDIIKSQLKFQVNKKTGKWSGNDPREQEKFLLETQDKKFTLIVEAPPGLDSVLAPVGWITSAYLLAFFTFGYRYILHSGLNLVRDYIVKSLDEEANAHLERPKLDDFGLTECKEHNFETPEICLVVPVDGKTCIYLQISFLDYHVRLPFHGIPEILQGMILDVSEYANRLPDLIGTEGYLYCPISCNKADGHDCRWDNILGKPIPGMLEPINE